MPRRNGRWDFYFAVANTTVDRIFGIASLHGHFDAGLFRIAVAMLYFGVGSLCQCWTSVCYVDLLGMANGISEGALHVWSLEQIVIR